MRATYAFSPHLTLQWYSQAFLSSGAYPHFLEVRDAIPRSIANTRLDRDIDGSLRLDSGSDSTVRFSDPAFSERVLNLNLVLRWEFLPGSTAFLVWTEQRSDANPMPFRVGRDFDRLVHAPATDALQLKVSYWLTP